MDTIDKEAVAAAFGWLPSTTKTMADGDWMAARARLRADEPAPENMIAALRYARSRMNLARRCEANMISRNWHLEHEIHEAGRTLSEALGIMPHRQHTIVDIAKHAAIRLKYGTAAPRHLTDATLAGHTVDHELARHIHGVHIGDVS